MERGDSWAGSGLGIALGWTTACGAGEEVRPKDPTAADVTASKTGGGAAAATASCRSAHGEGTVLVVDWSGEERGDLEIATREGIAMVRYDCQSIRLLRDCRLEGAYSFVGEPRAEQVLALNGADEVKAKLPLKGGAISASLGRTSSIDIALVTVGKRATTLTKVGRRELKGDCADATHFVRSTDVGAFSFQTGTVGAVRSAAELFGAGASASSTSSRSVSKKDGDYGACSAATAAASRPPAQCSAIVRIQLVSVQDWRRWVGDPLISASAGVRRAASTHEKPAMVWPCLLAWALLVLALPSAKRTAPRKPRIKS